jgi:hypothetical protein
MSPNLDSRTPQAAHSDNFPITPVRRDFYETAARAVPVSSDGRAESAESQARAREDVPS